MTPKWYLPAPVSSWHKEFSQIASMYPRGVPETSCLFLSLRSVCESNPRSFQIIACLGLKQCESLLMTFRSGASVFYTLLDLLHTRSTDLQSQMFWELIFPVQDSLVGSLMLSRTPHSLGRTSAIVIILLFVGNLPSYMSLDCIASLFLYILLGVFPAKKV